MLIRKIPMVMELVICVILMMITTGLLTLKITAHLPLMLIRKIPMEMVKETSVRHLKRVTDLKTFPGILLKMDLLVGNLLIMVVVGKYLMKKLIHMGVKIHYLKII